MVGAAAYLATVRGGGGHCTEQSSRGRKRSSQENFDAASVVLDSSNLESPKEEVKKILKINVKQAHEYLGHLSEDKQERWHTNSG
jgi:hypothetical protein